MFMGILSALALIICGMLAAATLVVQKQPNAQQLIDKLRPYQGWIGVVVAILGAWSLIWALIYIPTWLLHGAVLWWLTFFLTSALEFALGFILGYPILSQWLAKNEEAKMRGEQLQQKLTTYQTPLGIAGIVVGLWCLLAFFILL
jgi:hypothetical protein